MMTEIEKVKQEIKMLQSKLSFLEEIETHNAKPKMHLENEGEFGIVTYDGGTYYRLEYPNAILWYKRQKTFSDLMLVHIVDLEAHCLLEDKWNNEVLTQKNDEPECPDDPPDYDEVEWDEKDNPKPMNEVIDRLENKWNSAAENSASYITDEVVDRLVKKYQAQKLWNRVRYELGYSVTCSDEIVDLVEKWIPEPQSAAGSQNVDVEFLVDGFNDCVRKMNEMLR